MKRHQVLAICLDGYEHSLGEEMTAAGEMPAFAGLRRQSARFRLDHGPAARTGLAGEHVATGLAPQAAQRWAAVHFDKQRYLAWQQETELTPFPAALRKRTVVFDPPYFDLERAPAVNGIVGWGAHDPGVPSASRPDTLRDELERRFGAYPAQEWIYGLAWSTPERTAEMARALAHATDVRADAAAWLLAEQAPEWDLALVTVSEPHSAIEGLWHGVDAAHPLRTLPSAAVAGPGLHAVYRAVDRLVGKLTAAAPEASVVVFSMHGMGPNRSDAPSMLLLAELLYRRSFGKPLFVSPAAGEPAGVPLLLPAQRWTDWVSASLPPGTVTARAEDHDTMPWMPAAWYAPFWRDMDCFALPSFYDGRIRVNLHGRESSGRVRREQYAAFCAELEAQLRACTDPRTGESVVERIERPETRDPLQLGPTEADLVIVWRGAPLALQHPELGLIGPVPYRRTGGHSGAAGFAWISGPSVQPGDKGDASAFDVVPTLTELLGEDGALELSGRSLYSRATG